MLQTGMLREKVLKGNPVSLRLWLPGVTKKSTVFECHGLRVKVMAEKKNEDTDPSQKAPHLDGHWQLAREGEKKSCILLVNVFKTEKPQASLHQGDQHSPATDSSEYAHVTVHLHRSLRAMCQSQKHHCGSENIFTCNTHPQTARLWCGTHAASQRSQTTSHVGREICPSGVGFLREDISI